MSNRAMAVLAWVVLCTWCARESHAQSLPGDGAIPAIGAIAKNFKLLGLDDKPIELKSLAKKGPVVVIVLRGYPGYQCPACSAQAGAFVERAKEFAELKAHVVLIYPGPADELKQRAEEFLNGEKLPEPLVLALDPDYRFTTAYGLRWEAAGETAYPSTFVLDAKRRVKFQKVSRTHGDRAEVDDVLAALREQ
jgi:thioredoxin-dependent peroxiredoxin